MNFNSHVKSTILALAVILFLAGCALPSMTPPPGYVETILPTTTSPAAATAIPATAAPAIVPQKITATNAAGLIAAVKIPVSNVQKIRWSSDGSTLGLITQNPDSAGNSVYSAVLLDGKTLTTKTVFSPTAGYVSDISSDARLVAVINAETATLDIYDLGDGNRDIVSITPQYTLNGATFSPDGKYFSLSSNDTWQVEIYSLPDGSLVNTLTGFETAAPIYNAGYYGSNSTILWHARATLQWQDITTGEMGAAAMGEDSFNSYTMSSDGAILAGAAAKTVNGNYAFAVTLWNVLDGSELRTIVLPDVCSSIAFSPDASMLAATVGSNVLVYEVATGNLLVTLNGHSGTAREVAFSPDGLSLISSGEDNQLILWQVPQ